MKKLLLILLVLFLAACGGETIYVEVEGETIYLHCRMEEQRFEVTTTDTTGVGQWTTSMVVRIDTVEVCE